MIRPFRKLLELLDVFGSPSDGQVPEWDNANSRFGFVDRRFDALVDVDLTGGGTGFLKRTGGKVLPAVPLTVDVDGLDAALADKAAKAILPINAKDYGCVGDGTTDDTIAAQSAITAALFVNRRLFFPAGKYLVDTLTITAQLTLEGEGAAQGYLNLPFAHDTTTQGSVLISRSGNDILIYSGGNNHHNHIVRNLRFLGKGMTDAGLGNAIKLDTSTFAEDFGHFTLEHCIFEDIPGWCVDANDGVGTVRSCYGFIWTDNHVGACANGMRLYGGPGMVINGIYFLMTAKDGFGLDITNASHMEVTGLIYGFNYGPKTSLGDYSGATGGNTGALVRMTNSSAVFHGCDFEDFYGSAVHNAASTLTFQNCIWLDSASASTGATQIAVEYTTQATQLDQLFIRCKFATSAGWLNGTPLHEADFDDLSVIPRPILIGTPASADGEGIPFLWQAHSSSSINVPAMTATGVGNYGYIQLTRARVDLLNVLKLEDHAAFQNIGTTSTVAKRIFISDDGSSVSPTTNDGDAPVRGDLSLNDWFRMTTANGAMGCVLVYDGSSVVTKKWGPIADCDFSFGTCTATLFSGSGASLNTIPESAVTNLTTDLAAKAPLASPALTGTPTAPTAAGGTNTTQIASTAYVHGEVVTLAPLTRTISTTAPLTGGGDLSANRTFAISAASGSAAGSMSSAHFTLVNGATDANTASAIVKRDASGNFSAATITVVSVAASGRVVAPWIGLTDGATINTDASLGNYFRVTIAGNRTMAAPTGMSDGQYIEYAITQDATGSRTMDWDSIFAFSGGIKPTLTTTASKRDVIAFRYDSTAAKFYCRGGQLNL